MILNSLRKPCGVSTAGITSPKKELAVISRIYIGLRRIKQEHASQRAAITHHRWEIGDVALTMAAVVAAVKAWRDFHAWEKCVILSFTPLAGIEVRDHGDTWCSELRRLPGMGDEDAELMAAMIADRYVSLLKREEREQDDKVEQAYREPAAWPGANVERTE